MRLCTEWMRSPESEDWGISFRRRNPQTNGLQIEFSHYSTRLIPCSLKHLAE